MAALLSRPHYVKWQVCDQKHPEEVISMSRWISQYISWLLWNTLINETNSSFTLKPHALRWRHNGRDGVSNHQPHDCLLNNLFGHRSKKTSKLRVTGLCEGNSPGTGEIPAEMASNSENVSIWWHHHGFPTLPWAFKDCAGIHIIYLPSNMISGSEI